MSEGPEGTKPLRISAGLHARLKAKAATEGKKLGAMAEQKLEELFEDPAQPRLPLRQPEPANV